MRVHHIEITHDLQPQYLQMVSQKASTYRSEIMIKFERENIKLDAKSILGMLLIPMRTGTRITIQTRGNDEEEAIVEMSHLLEDS